MKYNSRLYLAIAELIIRPNQYRIHVVQSEPVSGKKTHILNMRKTPITAQIAVLYNDHRENKLDI